MKLKLSHLPVPLPLPASYKYQTNSDQLDKGVVKIYGGGGVGSFLEIARTKILPPSLEVCALKCTDCSKNIHIESRYTIYIDYLFGCEDVHEKQSCRLWAEYCAVDPKSFQVISQNMFDKAKFCALKSLPPRKLSQFPTINILCMF